MFILLYNQQFFTKFCSVLANVGGTMGVCIGGSLLTLMEFIGFMIIQMTHCLFRKRKKVDSTPVKTIAFQ